MTEREKDKDSSVKPSDRLEAIKKEEKEDASSYYSQGASDEDHTADEFSKPVSSVHKDAEEMNFLKTIAFLGFGLAALAIVFILFFIRDLDHRVGGMDSTIAKLDEKMEPLRKEVHGNIDKLNTDVAKLQTKLFDYEKTMTVLELKRTLITIQDVTAGVTTPGVKEKADEVVASIKALLTEIGAGEGAASAAKPADAPAVAPAPAAEVKPAEAPAVAPAPAAEVKPADAPAAVPAPVAEVKPADAPAAVPAPAAEVKPADAPAATAAPGKAAEAPKTAKGKKVAADDDDDEDD